MESMERLTNKKILVTGGAGFIGHHLVADLVAQKNQVVVVDNLSSGKRKNVPASATFYQTDVRNKEDIKNIFEKEKPQIVFHFAAKPLVDEAHKNPYEAIETNVMGTVNILEQCRSAGNLESIVMVSSDKAYGKSNKLPYTEETPLNGDHPYDVSKSAADLIAMTYFKTYKLPIVITRFSNVYGPGDTNFSRIIPGIMEAMIKNKDFLIRSDGKMVREYTYVKDISQACIVLAVQTKENKGHAFNFGSKNIFSVIEVVQKMQGILGKKLEHKVLNIAKNEIPKQHLDWSKAKARLAWEPKFSFENGIKESFEWYKQFHQES